MIQKTQGILLCYWIFGENNILLFCTFLSELIRAAKAFYFFIFWYLYPVCKSVGLIKCRAAEVVEYFDAQICPVLFQLVSTQVSQWRNFQTIWKKGRGGMHQHSDRADKKQIFLVKLLIIFSLLAPRASKGCFLIRELLEEPKFRSVAQAGEKWQAQKILQRHVLKESSSINHHLSSTLISISYSIKCDTWRSLSQADYLYFLHTLTTLIFSPSLLIGFHAQNTSAELLLLILAQSLSPPHVKCRELILINPLLAPQQLLSCLTLLSPKLQE